MATAQFFDRYQSSLASGYTAGGTTLSVASVGSLPSTGDFWVLVETDGPNTEEVFKVTARSGTSLTVAGAQAGTAASNHGAGAVIRGAILTSAAITQLKQDISAGAGSSAVSMTVAAFDTETSVGTANPNNRSVVYLTDGAYQCFWTGTAWQYYYGSIRCVPMVDSQFSWLNQDSATIDTSGKTVTLSRVFGGADSLRARGKPITLTAPYQITALVVPDLEFYNFASCGIWIGESGTTPKMITNVAGFNSGPAFLGYRWTNPTTYSGFNDYTSKRDALDGSPIALRIKNDGTNIIRYTSMNGFSYMQMFSAARLSFLANVSQWGICLDTNGTQYSNSSITVLSWNEEAL